MKSSSFFLGSTDLNVTGTVLFFFSQRKRLVDLSSPFGPPLPPLERPCEVLSQVTCARHT
uniref:Uncharacterized protein n=1 Tax=Anguilla anguilla TaxID=7936 RepID=A0A0E9S8V0_ANGAN